MNKWLSRVWEAPQKALAHIVAKFTKAKEIGEYNGVKLYHWNQKGGMSLSTHIFLPFENLTMSEYQTEYIKHEYGHTIQSRKFGPLYLLVIGLPSIIWAGCFKNYRKKYSVSYYDFYTEAWANKLGDVKRED